MPYAKAIAAFIVPYVVVLLSPLGVSGDMSFEEALTTVVSALVVAVTTAVSVYFAKNTPK